jgi:hypothetical protein
MSTTKQEQGSTSNTEVDQSIVTEVSERILDRYGEMGDVATAIGEEVHSLRTAHGDDWEKYLNAVVTKLDLPELSRTTLLNYEKRYALSGILDLEGKPEAMPRSLTVSYKLADLADKHLKDFQALLTGGHIIPNFKPAKLDEILKDMRTIKGAKDYSSFLSHDKPKAGKKDENKTAVGEDTPNGAGGAENGTGSPQSEASDPGGRLLNKSVPPPNQMGYDVVAYLNDGTMPNTVERCHDMLGWISKHLSADSKAALVAAAQPKSDDVKVVVDTPKARPRSSKAQRATKE